ncbi:MAG: DEAD/DEAH box helicase [Thermoguttaceae bacterium]|nr:DEAD/DEAH box helicase [Thermoguttaceae bacterium]
MQSNDDSFSQEDAISREELAIEYLDQLPYEPYPFQEQAILKWFESDQGVLVCAPTGMGKTLIAEAGLYEALKTGKRAYYTTPLIALTEQKYAELQRTVERWGFDRSDVGLITGNRRENVDAKILVVVAEILFNRLLSSDAFERFSGKDAPIDASNPPVGAADATTEEKPVITAASLNAKRSVAISWQELERDKNKPAFQDDKEPPKPVLPVVPVNPEDFDEDENIGISNAYFSFDDVSVVVMDEFHQFADPERGVVWEFTLGLLPPHVRTLLISATVGNATEFASWLRATANRRLDIVQTNERKVPLVYEWVGDRLLTEQLEAMCVGTEEERLIPALVFCFNRDECWSIAETLKGKNVVDAERQRLVSEELKQYDMSQGAGPKLRTFLVRRIGVHHAGILPKYRRIVEALFQKKLLSFCVCTETLAAGINLPARSVVLPTLLKGPSGDKRLVESSAAHQMFGRAGRPQYDSQGYVFALAHEDDVKIARAMEKYNSIPEDVKDPKMREEKKKLKKKLPKRRTNEQYWSEAQFNCLINGAPGKLTSRGPTPWRLLAHMIEANSDVKPIRTLVGRRLMGQKRLEAAQRSLDQMFLTLWRGGFIRLAPNPASYGIPPTAEATAALLARRRELKEKARRSQPFGAGLFDDSILNDVSPDEQYDPAVYEREKARIDEPTPAPEWKLPEGMEVPEGFDFFGGGDLFDLEAFENNSEIPDEPKEEKDEHEPVERPALTFGGSSDAPDEPEQEEKKFDVNALREEIRDQLAASYKAARAYPTPKLKTLTSLRGVNPIYGAFLLEQLGLADRRERIQAFESLLETPATVARHLRVPGFKELPPGALAEARLDKQLLQLGLASLNELVPRTEEEQRQYWERRRSGVFYEEPEVYLICFAEKLRRLFNYQYPGVSTHITPVWAAGEIVDDFKGDFNKYILSKNLQKQEGVVFRHLLRLILLLEEFVPLEPKDCSPLQWRAELEDLIERLIATCRAVDASSVEETLVYSKKPDLLEQI